MIETAAFHLLLIDDDAFVAQSIKMILPPQWKLFHIAPENALDHKIFFHAALVDMHLTKNKKAAEGPAVIEKLCAKWTSLEVIAISGDPSLELMEKSLESGAKRFLQKPFSKEELIGNLEKIEALWLMRELESRGAGVYRWIGNSESSLAHKQKIAQLKSESGPILIEGETGTGKEVTVRLLNQQELGRPLIAVNIAGISESLFESELFGHVKGAFTGADSHKMGLIEAAQGGDLFLDEIEALSLVNQVKLLRFLETSEIKKVGAKETQFVQTRVLAASNQSLRELVKKGTFREDLYFRLAKHQLQLTPLKNRAEDLQELADYFLQAMKPRMQKVWSPEAILQLKAHSWPGNVRELKRVCEQVALQSPLPVIRAVDIQSQISNQVAAKPDDFSEAGLESLMQQYEKLLIRESLLKAKSVDAAAALLKVSRSTFYKKIKDYQLEEFKL